MADWGELLYLRLPLTDLSFSPFYCLIIDFSAIMFPEVLFVLRLIDDFCWALASSQCFMSFKSLGEPDLASGSDVNGSTESFEMVIEEATTDSAIKQNSGKMLRMFCSFIRFLSGA